MTDMTDRHVTDRHEPTDHPDESRQLVERLSLVLINMGFPPMAARVWAALMTSNQPSSTPGDLGEVLGVSPAAISGAVRYLQQVSLIERVAVPGSRRQHYRVSVDQCADAFVTKASALYQVSEVATEGIRVLGEGTRGGDRMADLRDFFDFMAAETPRMLAAWRATRA